MLEDSVFESAGGKKGRSPVTLVCSVAAHCAALSVVLLIPLLQIQGVPVPNLEGPLAPPPLLVKTEFEPIAPATNRSPGLRPDPGAVIEPQFIPNEIAQVVETPSVPSIPLNDSGAAVIRSVLGQIARKSEETVEPLPAPVLRDPPAAVAEEQPVRIGGHVQEANLIHQVQPTYPRLAIQTRIRGVVVLEAVINKDGTIESLRIVSGHPFLIQAAVDAVKQWVYR